MSESNQAIGQTNRTKRILIYVAILAIAFLVGLVPMWWKYRSCAGQLTSVQQALTISSLQNKLANATVDAKRGDYEPARQAASEFFTKLRTEVDRGSDSVFNAGQRNNLAPVFSGRDDTITLLARSDPASVDRLTDLYLKYRQVAIESPR
jgi:hypothetical protein